MKRLLTVCALLALACPAAAGPIVLSGDASLHDWTRADLNGGASWANRSYDRNGLANIGYWLSGTPGSDVPGFHDDSPGIFAPYLGAGSTTFVWDQEPVFTEWLRVSDWHDLVSAERTSAGWALLLTTPNGVWRSDVLDAGRSHFALFDGGDRYYLGMEDAWWYAVHGVSKPADWDYNDLVVSIPATPDIPEPASLLLFGTGLVGLRAWRRRWQ